MVFLHALPWQRGAGAVNAQSPNGMCACLDDACTVWRSDRRWLRRDAGALAARGMSGLHMAEMVVGIARSPALFDDKVSDKFYCS